MSAQSGVLTQGYAYDRPLAVLADAVRIATNSMASCASGVAVLAAARLASADNLSQ